MGAASPDVGTSSWPIDDVNSAPLTFNTVVYELLELGIDVAPERCPDLLNAKVSQAALERRAIAAVAIVNEKTWRSSISAAFDYLLGRPLRPGHGVIATCRICRLTCRTTKKTYSVWNQIVRTQKTSHANILDSCRFRNSRHPGDGPRL